MHTYSTIEISKCVVEQTATSLSKQNLLKRLKICFQILIFSNLTRKNEIKQNNPQKKVRFMQELKRVPRRRSVNELCLQNFVN